MRHILTLILASAFGASAALALPTARPDVMGASAPDAILLVAKKKPAPKPAKKRTQKNLGGIHPLVGSGDY